MRSEVPVSRIMSRDFVSLQVGDRLDFAEDVMQLGRVRHMPVLDAGRLVGVVTQRDLLAASLSRVLAFGTQERRAFLHSVGVSEVMTKQLVSVGPEASLREVALLLIRHKIGCIPVVGVGDALLGLVTETDLLRAAYLEDETGADAVP